MNYECYHCTFDQMLDEQDIGELIAPPSYDLASGYRLASGYYYHMGHNWARFEHGGRIKIGFDDFLVKLFGAMNSIALPPLGATLKKDQVGLTFGRDDQKAAALSPVTGTVQRFCFSRTSSVGMFPTSPRAMGFPSPSSNS